MKFSPEMKLTPPASAAAVASTLALNRPAAAADRSYSASRTTPQARPSGNGCCSSLMKRRFMGKATRTPRMDSTTLKHRICHHGSTSFVAHMYAASPEVSGIVM